MIEDIQKTIAESKDEIRQKYRAEVKGIFGSYARGDNHADSDLDLGGFRCGCQSVRSDLPPAIFGGQTGV